MNYDSDPDSDSDSWRSGMVSKPVRTPEQQNQYIKECDLKRKSNTEAAILRKIAQDKAKKKCNDDLAAIAKNKKIRIKKAENQNKLEDMIKKRKTLGLYFSLNKSFKIVPGDKSFIKKILPLISVWGYDNMDNFEGKLHGPSVDTNYQRYADPLMRLLQHLRTQENREILDVGHLEYNLANRWIVSSLPLITPEKIEQKDTIAFQIFKDFFIKTGPTLINEVRKIYRKTKSPFTELVYASIMAMKAISEGEVNQANKCIAKFMKKYTLEKLHKEEIKKKKRKS